MDSAAWKARPSTSELEMSDRCLLSADELLGFYFAETQRWRGWLAANQKLLDLPIDIAQAKTVRDLVLHIVAVDLRYAERLLGEKVTDYEDCLRLRWQSSSPPPIVRERSWNVSWDRQMMPNGTRYSALLRGAQAHSLPANARSSFTRCCMGCAIGRSLQLTCASKDTSSPGLMISF